MNDQAEKGILFLVPTPLDFGCNTPLVDDISAVLPAKTMRVSAQLTHWITENAKSTRAFLKRVHEHHPLAAPLQAMHIMELPREVHKRGDHSTSSAGAFDASHLLEAALTGTSVGLVSEAGMPGIADPGSSVVRAAHLLGLQVEPLVGPVSLMLALAASGLSGQNFAFVGYLPQDASARALKVRELEALALKTGQTQIFIETPYRNAALLQTLLQSLKPETKLSVSSGLTLRKPDTLRTTRSHFSATVKIWPKQNAPIDLNLPAVFLIGP